MKWSEVAQSCLTLCDPWTVTYQAPLSMGFLRQEFWSGLLFPSPEDPPNPGIEPGSSTLQTDALLSETWGKCVCVYICMCVCMYVYMYVCMYMYISVCVGVCLFYECMSVQFSISVMSNSLWPHGLQHARLPCPPPTPEACLNPCPSRKWCHPTISSSVIPFSSCPQSFPASGSFQMGQLFASGGQSIGVSASASVLPINIQDWFPLGLNGWNSL